jgi:2-polyprenyl-3-methyl-5-hydroxy-6-metoxy-1,4-benzoquinol methylase
MSKADQRHEELVQIFNKAEAYFANKEYEIALPLYHGLTKHNGIAALAYFRLGQIANAMGDPEYASQYYYKGYELDPGLNSRILPKDHHLSSHKYKTMDSRRIVTCPLCDGEGNPYWCYLIAPQPNCLKSMNPIRTWLYCQPCHHLWSAEPVEFHDNETPEVIKVAVPKARSERFPMYSKLINSLRGYTQGNTFLEVGVGSGECIAVARELLFDVTGIDIMKNYVDYVNKTFQMNVIHGDFLTHSFDRQFDIIAMGDVIEHVRNPKDFMSKAAELSHPGTVLWISTPNFESTFALYAGHNDPMRMEPGHCGYFSFVSLSNLLNEYGFDVTSYEVSAAFNGSMEVTAKYR